MVQGTLPCLLPKPGLYVYLHLFPLSFTALHPPPSPLGPAVYLPTCYECPKWHVFWLQTMAASMPVLWPALSRTSLSAACPPAGIPLVSAARHCTVRKWANSSDSTASLVPVRQPACRAEAASGAAVVRFSCNPPLRYDSTLHASTDLLSASPLPTLPATGAR